MGGEGDAFWGPSSGVSLSCLCMPQLADISSLGFPLLGVKGSLPVGGASSDWPRVSSMKSWLWNPLSELPWRLGSSPVSCVSK